MWILPGITVSMMHSVHYCIGSWHQKGRTLCQPGQKVKRLLPASAGSIHLVGGKPVQEKGMKKQRKKPMTKEKQQDEEHLKD